jgi:holin-like protein
MLSAFLSLVVCQLLGELIREALNLPIPGPVIGMFILAAILGWRSYRRPGGGIPKQLDTVAEGLITNMGLLFVPAGVGIIAEVGLLQQEWLPIIAGLLGSTILSVAVTGLVMHQVIRRSEKVPGPAATSTGQPAE